MDTSNYVKWCGSKYTHFIGIGGAGMSAIAAVLLDMGCRVSGSDIKLNGFAKRLRGKGAIISEGHNGFNIKNTGLVVVSSAIPSDNAEVREAKKANIPIIQRAEMLNILMQDKRGIVISGSHGKTTTTSMISLILEKAGLDPTVLIGGELNDIGGNAKLGRGEYLVAEGDESDGSLLKLFPYMAVITNIEDDHLDYYKNLKNIKKAFSKFLDQVSPQGGVVVCKDNENVIDIIGDFGGKVVTYGIKNRGDIYAIIDKTNEFTSSSRIYINDEYVGVLNLRVPGVHNVYNALAAIGISVNIGIGFERIAEILKDFRGASRRFQTLYKNDEFLVIDDYAHHPTEIAATIKTARIGWAHRLGRVVVVFQPHRYTRTQYLRKKFARSLKEADIVFLTEIYPAGEKPIHGVSSRLIYEEMMKDSDPHATFYVPDKTKIPHLLMDTVEPGDIILFMGAGDIWEEGVRFANLLRESVLLTY